MYYRINEIKLKAEQSQADIPASIIKKLGKAGKGLKITDWRIVKQSVDARDKGDILIVYSLDFAVEPKDRKLDLPQPEPKEYILPDYVGSSVLKYRPVVCGFGPCGMYAALILASAGFKPIVLERGSEMKKRIVDVENFLKAGKLNTESNVQFGEGGAGTFSDGKLTTNIKDARISKVLTEFVEAGADENILYKHRAHIGTDVLRDVVVNIRKKIISLGGEVKFDTRLEDIVIEEGRVRAIKTNKGDIETDCLLLALGHSARDTFRMLNEHQVKLQQKPFSIGVRIQHPQELINVAQYGKNYHKLNLPPAEYKLSYHCKSASEGGENDGRGVYTFCMCPGGEVINSSSHKEGVVTNGMSYNARDGEFANRALLVDVRTSDFSGDHALAGIEFQEKYEHLAYLNGGENYSLPSCTTGEFMRARKGEFNAGEAVISSLPRFAVSAISEALPHMARQLRGFDSEEAKMFAVETRSSSPVRIVRNEDLQASVGGLYPCGEGAGYAGGIVSAAVDGIRVAEKIVENYKPNW